MDYEKLTKEELISLLNELEGQRAFTYEDRMKLEILDQSPFTIWASDRATDEKDAARDDQLKIIDHGEVFHNMANDHGKDGNILQLVTICRRIRDIKTGEYWNAEMGLIIDYFEAEKERLNQVIAESQKVKSYTSQFKASVKQDKTHFLDRKKAITSSIREYESTAISHGKRREFKKSVSTIREALKEIEDQLNVIINKYVDLMEGGRTYDSCEQTRLEYISEYTETLNSFEDVVLDIEEIAQGLNCPSSVMSGRDVAMRDEQQKYRLLANDAHNLLMRAEEEITEYKKLNVSADSERMKSYIKRRERIKGIRSSIEMFDTDIRPKLLNAVTDESVQSLRAEMESAFEGFENELNAIKEEMGLMI